MLVYKLKPETSDFIFFLAVFFSSLAQIASKLKYGGFVDNIHSSGFLFCSVGAYVGEMQLCSCTSAYLERYFCLAGEKFCRSLLNALTVVYGGDATRLPLSVKLLMSE